MIYKNGIKKSSKKELKRFTFPVEKGSKLGDISSKLTPKQMELYSLISKEFMTIKELALVLSISQRAVYKRLNILSQKGVYSMKEKKVQKIVPTTNEIKPTFPMENIKVPQETKVTSDGTLKFPVENMIRLHGQEFRVDILQKGAEYEKLKNRSNYINIDGNTIRLSANSIEIYSNESFWGDTVDKATYRSVEYFNRLFKRIENDLKIVILKSRKQNIKLVNSHYAEIKNGLAIDCNNKKEKLKFYCRDDGRLWFLIDNSFNLNEMETVHPETSKDDMSKLKHFFDDIRQNELITLSDIKNLILNLTKENLETAKGLSSVVQMFTNNYKCNIDDEINFNNDYDDKLRPNYIG